MDWNIFFTVLGVIMGTGFVTTMFYHKFTKWDIDFIKWSTIDFSVGIILGLLMGWWA